MILINKLHKYFEDEFKLSEIDSIKLKYSLELIIGDISKLIILLILFGVLGKATDFIYSSLVLIIIRPFTGGLHFKTYGGCIIFSGCFFYISIFLNTHIDLSLLNIIIMFIFSLFTIIIFAPVCGKSRPNYSYKRRLQFKLISITFILIHFSICLFAHKTPYFTNSVWVITLQCIQILIAKGVKIHEENKISIQKTT